MRNLIAGAALLAWATWLSPLLLAVSTLARPGAAAAAAGAITLPRLGLMPLLLVAALTAAAVLLGKVRSRFIFRDYVHAHK